MSGESKFSSKRPKGDAWGVEDAVARAADEFRQTGRSPMIPFVGVMAVAKIEMTPGDDGHPVYVPIMEIRRANSLDTPEAIRAGQRLILRAIKDQEGSEDAVQTLPLDERQIIMDAFGGVDQDQVDEDSREAEEEATMPEPDKLRRHLIKVHGFDQAEVDGWEMFDVHKTHDVLHQELPAETMPHDKEWWGWRRVVLEEKAAELRGEGVTWGPADGEPAAETEEPMDDLAEMKAHLSVVHNFDDSLLAEESLEDLRHRHVADHDTPPEDGFPAHDLAWLGHTTDDLDAAEASAEDDQTAADVEPAADETKD